MTGTDAVDDNVFTGSARTTPGSVRGSQAKCEMGVPRRGSSDEPVTMCGFFPWLVRSACGYGEDCVNTPDEKWHGLRR